MLFWHINLFRNCLAGKLMEGVNLPLAVFQYPNRADGPRPGEKVYTFRGGGLNN